MAKKNINPKDLTIPICSQCGKRLRDKRTNICKERVQEVVEKLNDNR